MAEKYHPRGALSWVPCTVRVLDLVVLQNSGLDAFFLLRYIRILFVMFASFSVVILPTLVALNSVGIGATDDTMRGLDKLCWANAGSNGAVRRWAHLIMALGIIGFVCRTIHNEG